MRPRRPSTHEDPVFEFYSFEQFEALGTVPESRFSIDYEGVPVDFIYQPVAGARTTVVMFHGSTNKDVSIPMLSGVGIMSGLRANRLAISDPSLTLDDSKELILSWFMGSARQPYLQFFIERVIRRVKEITNTPRLIFMGGSGGGFAALEMSRRFGNSVVLAMNPQTSLSTYYPRLVREYLNICWDGADNLSRLPKHVVHDIGSVYPATMNHTVAYLQNTRDKHHVDNHQRPFFEKVGASRNVYTLMGAWGDPAGKGHVQAPKEIIRNILEQLIAANGAWATCLVELGFTRKTSPDDVARMVEKANARLPKQLVKDVM